MGAAGGAFEAKNLQEIVRVNVVRTPHAGAEYQTYDVSADGQKFLVFQRVVTNAGATSAQTSPDPTQGLVVAMHWAEAMKK